MDDHEGAAEGQMATVAESGEKVTVTVNNKAVTLPSHRVTGLEIKRHAIEQGVDIKLDFQLIEEAHGDHPAREIENHETITVNKHSEFTANDGDDDS
jgi:hypothetical protein